MIRFPNAKINLGLDVVRKRTDGYHDLSTLFYPIPLKDIVEIVENGKPSGATLYVTGNAIDCPAEKNLVVRAYNMMNLCVDIPGVDIHLHKSIPDGAGLGGGSADASNVLLILNDMFNLGKDKDELALLASTLGADCPFFIYNTPQLASGIGDVFTPIDLDLKGLCLLLIKPDVYISTKLAYSKVTPEEPQVKICDIVSRPIEQWKGLLKNDFEVSVFDEFTELEQIKSDLYDSGALYASMSGSGSSIFGIFSDSEQAQKASEMFTYQHKYILDL